MELDISRAWENGASGVNGGSHGNKMNRIEKERALRGVVLSFFPVWCRCLRYHRARQGRAVFSANTAAYRSETHDVEKHNPAGKYAVSSKAPLCFSGLPTTSRTTTSCERFPSGPYAPRASGIINKSRTRQISSCSPSLSLCPSLRRPSLPSLSPFSRFPPPQGHVSCFVSTKKNGLRA